MGVVNVIDESGRFTPDELEELATFLVEQCHTTTEDLDWLESVIIRDEPGAEWLGKWQARFIEVDDRREELTAVIVLNSFYLRLVSHLERTLAHEYGHNWSLGHLLVRGWLSHTFEERVPPPYYRIRRLDQDKYAEDERNGWAYCDKEVLAEDYRCLLSPHCDSHRMRKAIGHPSSEVRQYLVALGRPSWMLD